MIFGDPHDHTAPILTHGIPEHWVNWKGQRCTLLTVIKDQGALIVAYRVGMYDYRMRNLDVMRENEKNGEVVKW